MQLTTPKTPFRTLPNGSGGDGFPHFKNPIYPICLYRVVNLSPEFETCAVWRDT